MTNYFDIYDRNVLEFRPKIEFIEPDQQPGTIEGKSYLQYEDVKAGRDKIKKLAESVNVLATGMQARTDIRAKNIVIKLDENIDQDAIQAMMRRYPGTDPTQITYDQYRECREGVIQKGILIGNQGLIGNGDGNGATEINLENELKKDRDIGFSGFNPGGLGTDKENNGQLRPELNANAQIIPPINIREVQVSLICILVNYIWKNYIKKIIVNTAPPVSWAFNGLPDKICDPGMDMNIRGLLVLGKEPDDLLTGKTASKSAAKVGVK